MRSQEFLKICKIFSVFVLLVSCQREETLEDQHPMHEAVTLENLFESNAIYELYKSAYPSFTFESTAIPTETSKPIRAHTELKKNELGNELLIRTPLYSEFSSELRIVSGKAYFKPPERTQFVRTRRQDEFDRWLERAFSEVLIPYSKVGFQKEKGELKDSLLCVTKDEGFLCCDPNTGLPVKGSIRTQLANSIRAQIDFSVTQQPPKTITILEP